MTEFSFLSCDINVPHLAKWLVKNLLEKTFFNDLTWCTFTKIEISDNYKQSYDKCFEL